MKISNQTIISRGIDSSNPYISISPSSHSFSSQSQLSEASEAPSSCCNKISHFFTAIWKAIASFFSSIFCCLAVKEKEVNKPNEIEENILEVDDHQTHYSYYLSNGPKENALVIEVVREDKKILLRALPQRPENQEMSAYIAALEKLISYALKRHFSDEDQVGVEMHPNGWQQAILLHKLGFDVRAMEHEALAVIEGPKFVRKNSISSAYVYPQNKLSSHLYIQCITAGLTRLGLLNGTLQADPALGDLFLTQATKVYRSQKKALPNTTISIEMLQSTWSALIEEIPSNDISYSPSQLVQMILLLDLPAPSNNARFADDKILMSKHYTIQDLPEA